MKKPFIYICIFLAGAIFNHIQAQEKHETATTKNISRTEDNQASITIDPKLSSDKQALILQAGKDNPAKGELVGTDEKKPGETVSAADQMIDGEENNPKADSGKADSGGNTQPAGEVPSRITNYREINGSDTQPEGEQPGKITNYREMNGTNTQPEGKKPEKR